MESFKDYALRTRGVTMPQGTVPSTWFYENDFPMVVRCCCCDMSMALPSAWVDDQGYTYCSDCAGVDEE